MDNNRNLVKYGLVVGVIVIAAVIAFFVYRYVTADDATQEPAAATTATDSTAAAALTPAPADNGGGAGIKILIVDRNEVLGRSVAGQKIMKQVQQLAGAAEAGIKGRGDALRKDYADFQQQASILAANVKAAKLKAIEDRKAALDADIQKQQMMIQGGLYKAREQVIAALKPIIHQIMVERGATLVVERGALADFAPSNDITALATERLNAALPDVTVTPQMPPSQAGQGQPQ